MTEPTTPPPPDEPTDPATTGEGVETSPPPPGAVAPPPGSVLVVAHRALSAGVGVVENSLAGIRRAAEAGADLVELDVRRSLDGVPFLLHDRSLNRTTVGYGPIRWEPSAYLRRVRLRDSDERLPTLAAALDALPPGVGPALHLKDQGSLLAALRVIGEAGVGERTWLWLHGTAAVRLARARSPEIRVTLLEAGARTLTEWVRHLDGAKAAGAAGVSIPWPDLSADLLREITSRDLMAFSLHHDLERIPAWVGHGLAGIISDEPEVVRRTLDGLDRRPGSVATDAVIPEHADSG